MSERRLPGADLTDLGPWLHAEHPGLIDGDLTGTSSPAGSRT